jgi:DNA-binding winged helix-turn-helix (wHTH) protein
VDELQLQVARALRQHVLPACIGPATGEVLEKLTGAEPCLPDHHVLGALGRAVAERLRDVGHRHVRAPDGQDIVVQGRLVDGCGVAVLTSDREASVLKLLVGPPVRTVSRAEIFRSVWHGDAVTISILDNTVVRLRRRIDGTGLSFRTVHGRGYLLEGAVHTCRTGTDADHPGREEADPCSIGGLAATTA